MIRMMGMIDLPATGMNKSVYDEAVKQTEASLGLSEYGPRDLPQREVPTGFNKAPHRAKKSSSMPSQSPPPKRKPGDIWQTRQGWGAMNKDGQTKYFNGDHKEEKFDAEDFAHGKGNYSPERVAAINNAGSSTNENKTMKTESRTTIESLIRSPRLQKMVKEEYVKILDESKERAPKIAKQLEGMRSKMCEEFVRSERKGTFTGPAMEKRMQINTVAELLDMPVNELMLYFINEVKTTNERQLVEYHLGHVYFYAN